MPSVDGRAFLQDLKILEEAIVKHAAAAVERAVDETVKHAQKTTLFVDRSGVLRKSITGWSYGMTGEAAAVAPYAKYVNNGTKPHLIAGNPFLTFVWNGVNCSFRYVNHPGSAPREFMDLARDWGEAVLRQNADVMVWDDINQFNAR